MMRIYHILTFTAFILVLPLLPLVWLVSEKRRANLLQRLGIFTGFAPKSPGEFRIWVHALSVGEVKSAIPFVKGLKKKKPGACIVFTASTRTGYETACELLDSGDASLGYFPFDLWFSVSRIAGRISPDLVCIVETDLWPGFLHYMKDRKVPVVLVNARLSKKSLKGYLGTGRFAPRFFSFFSHIMVQTKTDAGRFRKLGVPSGSLSVTGNIKFDQPPVLLDKGGLEDLRQKFGIGRHDLVLVAGSTHEGEEEILVAAFTSLKKKNLQLKLILAPRDPKRSSKLIQRRIMAGSSPVLLSELKCGSKGHDIVIIDSLGVLASAYGICNIAFVGGSLVPLGGHNPLEPAMFEKPVLFGPHMTDFSEVAGLLTAAEGGLTIGRPGQLEKALEKILTDNKLAVRMGSSAGRVFFSNAGAVDRTIKRMGDLNLV